MYLDWSKASLVNQILTSVLLYYQLYEDVICESQAK